MSSAAFTDGYENIVLAVPRDAAKGGPVLLRSTIPRVLPQSHVLLRVSRFGFSTNNITYQTLGEAPHFRYFDFHPAPESPETYGIVPVWGFATVVASTARDIHPGERVFGYLAPARYLLLPIDTALTNSFHFYVPRPHFPPDRRPYNQLTRCARDALYSPHDEDLAMLYRPLFWTAFWAEDWLHGVAPAYAGARAIVISSASARTAFCLAFCIRLRRATPAVRVVGLTSARNRAYADGLGLYDGLVVYEDVEHALADAAGADGGAVVYVDVAGNGVLNSRVWAALGARVTRSVSLGLTNLTPSSTRDAVPPTSTMSEAESATSLTLFFMPEHLATRRRELGTRGIAEMQRVGWQSLMRACGAWGVPERVAGAEKVRGAWDRAVRGGGGAGVWSLWDARGGDDGDDVDVAPFERAKM